MSEKRKSSHQRLKECFASLEHETGGAAPLGQGNPAVLKKAGLILAADDRAIRKAFEVAGLDPNNAADWKRLLGCFAKAHYERDPGGRPEIWSYQRLSQLLVDFHRVKRKHPDLQESQVFERLKKDKPFNELYGRIERDTLRKNLNRARSATRDILIRNILKFGGSALLPCLTPSMRQEVGRAVRAISAQFRHQPTNTA
jgi:hypothetical protein